MPSALTIAVSKCLLIIMLINERIVNNKKK